MRVTSLIACTSIAVIDLVPQVETYTVLLSGVNVTQAGPPPRGAFPGTSVAGRETCPISLRSGSEYTKTALAGLLLVHKVLWSGEIPMPWLMPSHPGGKPLGSSGFLILATS